MKKSKIKIIESAVGGHDNFTFCCLHFPFLLLNIKPLRDRRLRRDGWFAGCARGRFLLRRAASRLFRLRFQGREGVAASDRQRRNGDAEIPETLKDRVVKNARIKLGGLEFGERGEKLAPELRIKGGKRKRCDCCGGAPPLIKKRVKEKSEAGKDEEPEDDKCFFVKNAHGRPYQGDTLKE